jgi:hypothetical protein
VFEGSVWPANLSSYDFYLRGTVVIVYSNSLYVVDEFGHNVCETITLMKPLNSD